MAQALTLEDRDRVEAVILAAIDRNPWLNVRHAARAAGISHTTLYKLMNQNPAFAKRIHQAQAEAREAVADLMEDILLRIALDPKSRASASACIFLLRAHKPEVYGPRRVRAIR